jgi:hypothetical protein
MIARGKREARRPWTIALKNRGALKERNKLRRYFALSVLTLI